MMKSDTENQRGVALILALSILSLLLVMAIAFATNAILNRKSAANSSSQSQARILARSAVARVQARVAKSLQAGETDFSDIYSTGTKDGADVIAEDKLKYVNDDDDTLLKVFLAPQTIRPTTNPKWEFVYDKYTTAGLPDNGDANKPAKIIGRFAFSVVPNLGQINFSEVVRGNLADPIRRDWNNRLGVDMREFNISDCFETSGTLNWAQFLADAHADVVPSPDTDDTATKDYSADYTVFFETDAFKNNITGGSVDSTKIWLQDWFSLNGRNEAEMFFYQPNAVPGADKFDKETAVRYHRFHLARNDWNNLGVAGVDGNTVNRDAVVNRLLGKPQTFKTTDTQTNVDSGLPFLRMIGENKATFDKLEYRRKQIAANLIDYCTADTVPATSDSGDWWATSPNYTGNKKYPYLNKVAVAITSTADVIKDGAEGTTVNSVKANISLSGLGLELIDLYGNFAAKADFANKKIKAKVSGSVSITATLDSDTQSGQLAFNDLEILFDNTDSTTVKTDGNINYAYSYQEAPTTQTITLNKPSSDNSNLISVKITGIQIDKLYLCGLDSQIPLDFSKNLKGSTERTMEYTPDAIDGKYFQTHIVGLATDDPRVNLNPADWSEISLATQLTAEPTAANFENSGIEFGQKHATASDPQQLNPASMTLQSCGLNAISTFYIRENPMKSPMELAAISRGAKWETLNVLSADSTFSHISKYAPEPDIEVAGTTLTQGDGGLWDQIKMTDKTFDSPKLDLNARSQAAPFPSEIFSALTRGVKVQAITFGNDLNQGTAIDKDQSRNIGTVLATKPAAAKPLFSRAELLYPTYHSDRYGNAFGKLSAALTLPEQAALVGKTMMLTTTNPPASNLNQAVVVAQSIKDNGDVTISKYKNNTDTTPVSRDTKFGHFDHDKANNIYFDEITGEMKMLMTFECLPDQRIRVINTTFIEE